MLTATQTGTRFYTVKNMVSFCVGWWNGRPHALQDLQELADNYNRLINNGGRPLYVPFATLNHQDPDRCGWVSGCRVAGNCLLLDVSDIPEDVAIRIRQGRLAYPSIEYWDTRNDPRARMLSGFGYSSPGGQPPGLILRCVTILGSMAPGAKGLPELPIPQLQSGGGSRIGSPASAIATQQFLDRSVAIRRFSYEGFMNRSSMLQALQAAFGDKISADTLATFSDDQLAKMLGDAQQNAAMGQADPAAAGAPAGAPPASPGGAQADAAPAMDPAMAGGMAGGAPAGMPMDPNNPAAASQAYSDMAALRKFAHDAKAERVEQVVQTAIAKGQLMPTQAAFARKTGMASGVTPIPPASATFADATKATGKPAPTEFDVWAAEIAALPVDSRFIQKFGDTSGAKGGTTTVAPGGRATGLGQNAMDLLNTPRFTDQNPVAKERILKRFAKQA